MRLPSFLGRTSLGLVLGLQLACGGTADPADRVSDASDAAHPVDTTGPSFADAETPDPGPDATPPPETAPDAAPNGGGDAGAADGMAASDPNDASQDASSDRTDSGAPAAETANHPRINGVQWADVEGEPIQAHGGGMLKVGDDYYWFGENRNPDGTFFAVSAYRSRDLHHWEHAHDVLTMHSDPGLSPANVERPKVVYNARTGKYVMWMHWENGQHYGEARAAVASADRVDGDYTYHGSFRPFQDSGVVDHDRPGYMSRDCTLFVDDDGSAYFLSASNENYDLHLYALTDDYLAIARFEGKLFEGAHREAPALFKREGVYFLVTSGSTGWSPNQARYATSNSLTDGWSSLRDLGDATTFHTQSTYVLPVEGPNGTNYLYMGDRWAGAWQGRVNDSQYVWLPLSFPDDTTLRMEWQNTLALDANQGVLEGAVQDFVFVNEGSGMAMSVDGPAERGSPLVQTSLGSTTLVGWKLAYNGAGHFRLRHTAGDAVVDVPNETTYPNVDLQLWDDNGGAHQGFRLVDLGEGRYRVQNQNSGHVLGVAGASTESGARIQQQEDTGADSQIWRLVAAD